MGRAGAFAARPRRGRGRAWILIGLCVLAAPVVGLADPIQGSHHIEISGLTFVVDRGATSELVVWSERAHYDPMAQAVRLEQVHISVGPELDRRGLMIRSDTGVLALGSDHFRLQGNVSGVTDDGRRFETEWLEYNDARKLLFSDAPVTIREAGGVYRGGGLQYEIEARRFRLLGGARVVREP